MFIHGDRGNAVTSTRVCLWNCCLPACLVACLPGCLSAYQPVCLPLCVTACVTTCLRAYLPVCLPACLPTCLPVCLLASLPACLPGRPMVMCSHLLQGMDPKDKIVRTFVECVRFYGTYVLKVVPDLVPKITKIASNIPV